MKFKKSEEIDNVNVDLESIVKISKTPYLFKIEIQNCNWLNKHFIYNYKI